MAVRGIPKAFGLEAATVKYARESPQSCRAPAEMWREFAR